MEIQRILSAVAKAYRDFADAFSPQKKPMSCSPFLKAPSKKPSENTRSCTITFGERTPSGSTV